MKPAVALLLLLISTSVLFRETSAIESQLSPAAIDDDGVETRGLLSPLTKLRLGVKGFKVLHKIKKVLPLKQ